MPRIAHLTSAHPRHDTRIFVKQCRKLADHGYDVTLVGDAHTTDDSTAHGAPEPAAVIAHTNLYWSWQDAPGRTAAVVDSADIDFAVATS